MNAKQFIEAAGGHKTVMTLTGLSRSALSNWEHQNYIPPHWIKFFSLLNPVIRKAKLELEPSYPTSKKRLSVVHDSSDTQQKNIDSTRQPDE